MNTVIGYADGLHIKHNMAAEVDSGGEFGTASTKHGTWPSKSQEKQSNQAGKHWQSHHKSTSGKQPKLSPIKHLIRIEPRKYDT